MKLTRPSLATAAGALLLAALVVSSLVYTFYIGLLLSKTPPPNNIAFLGSWDPRNVILVGIVAFGISLLLLFKNRKKTAPNIKLTTGDERYDKTLKEVLESEFTPPTPRVAEEVTLAKLLGAAMTRGLSADLNFTLKLPADTKLSILGQDWEVQNGTITISKAKQEEKPLAPSQAKPEDMMTEEEKKYYVNPQAA